MKKINFEELDLGDEVVIPIPFSERKSISLLLGAGFSAPKGYPVGNTVNKKLLEYHTYPISFSPAGEIATTKTGEKPEFGVMGYQNRYEKQYSFCLDLIKYYNENNKNFDYEIFYDFIKSKEIYAEEYQHLASKYLSEIIDFNQLVFGLPAIYNQMVAYILKDNNSKQWYDDIPYHLGKYDGYNGFLKYIQELAENHIVNVHTLNHDLFFESLNKTEYINGNISDGFDEYGSNYYGILDINNIKYHCRLERYTGHYLTPIRLYKLHGSLNYVLYHRTKGISLIPDKYIKIRYGMSASDLLRGIGSKKHYESYPFAYHADYLTGTTSKILRYKERYLYKKLFHKFKQNLSKSEKLIIIGYGAKDAEINNIIMKYFNHKNKPVYIIDPYAKGNDTVEKFAKEIHAQIITCQIEDINKEMFG